MKGRGLMFGSLEDSNRLSDGDQRDSSVLGIDSARKVMKVGLRVPGTVPSRPLVSIAARRQPRKSARASSCVADNCLSEQCPNALGTAGS